MRRAAIVSPVRTPSGFAGGAVAAVPPWRLAAAAIAGAVGRAELDVARVDEVVLAGPPGVARPAALGAGLPSALAGFEVGSGDGLSALIVAATMLHAETAAVVVAGGVHDTVPAETALAAADPAHAERLAERYHLERTDSDEFALGSRRRAARAWRQGIFDAEIVPVVAAAPDELRHRSESAVPHLVGRDEQSRAGMSTRALTSLAPLLPGGVLTAAAVSVPGAGAADSASDRGVAMLFESSAAAPAANTPRGARFHGLRSRRSGRHRA